MILILFFGLISGYERFSQLYILYDFKGKSVAEMFSLGWVKG